MKSTYKKYISGAVITVTLIAVTTLSAFAQTNNPNASGQTNPGQHQGQWQGRGPGMMNGKSGTNTMPSGVMGIVSSINGTAITVASHGFGANTATTTYSVNASNSTVLKNNATSTLSSVLVGDRIFAEGTVSGTSVTATTIRDGMMRGRGPGTTGGNKPENSGNQAPLIKGNGQPVVAGTVSSVSGTTITITTSSNTSYTIDASNAVVNRNGASSVVSALVSGDYVVVQGTVNGNSVTASSIIDRQAMPANSSVSKGSTPSGHTGFFGSIGNFFKNLFGF